MYDRALDGYKGEGNVNNSTFLRSGIANSPKIPFYRISQTSFSGCFLARGNTTSPNRSTASRFKF